ncbi:sensor histidine kinase [Polluticaenibacter yanchengensis]|uniref:histidine kinase n=1 Tax=Polluticaenibacter yanchengensis TaxID=3014562 RepID=A0ABT4UL16_9BACT|nr:histidine kinase [Chitinophagaceae bacterium LY-5]
MLHLERKMANFGNMIKVGMKYKILIIKYLIHLSLLIVFNLFISVTGNANDKDSTLIQEYVKKGAGFLKVNTDSVVSYFNKSIYIATSKQSSKDSIIALYAIARAYSTVSDYFNAKNYWYKALELCNRTQLDPKREIQIYIRLADLYTETTGAKDSAALCYYIAEQKLNNSSFNDPNFNALINTRLAYYWLQLNNNPIKEDLENGRYYIDRVKKDSSRLNQNSQYELYFLEGFYHSVNIPPSKDSSRHYYLKYLENEDSLLLYNKIAAYINLSNACLELGYLEESNLYIQKLYALKPKMHPLLLSYFETLVVKLAFLKKNYSSTVKLGSQLIDQLKRDSILNITVLELYDFTAKAYDSIGLYKEASMFKSEYIKLSDSLFNIDRIQTASRLAVRSRMAEKDKEIAQKELALAHSEMAHKNKNFWIICIVITLISLIIISILTYINNRNKIKSQEKQMEINHLKDTVEGEENERKRLARELHDGLGGILTAIRIHFGLLTQKFDQLKEDKIYDENLKLIEEASNELRKTAHNLAPDLVTQHGLMYALESFCNRVASGTDINLSFQVIGEDSGNRSASVDLTIYRVIQELVHNIIKHSKASKALVQIQFINQDIIITVEDNGIGVPANILATSKGIGLQNIKSRVENINGSFSIQSKVNAGTSINIEIFN